VTVDEYAEAVELLIKTRELSLLNVLDLRLNLRFTRKRGAVDGWDLLMLKNTGVPLHGYMVKVVPRPVKKKAVQVAMF